MTRTLGRIRRIAGLAEVEAALKAGAQLATVLVRRDTKDPAVAAVVERAMRSGPRVRRVSAGVLRRMSNGQAADILAFTGRAPDARLDDLLLGTGSVWLLVGLNYPSNVGMAIRTAEVAGADGIVIDSAFNAAARRFALRISVRSDWYMPVLWEDSQSALERARAAGWSIIAIEHTGTEAPWQVDLSGRVLLVAGGETDGIPHRLLERCDRTVRVPMAGFIPSYNVQAAIAAIAFERLRQLRQGR